VSIFYHVDCNMSLKQGQKIELVHYNDIKPEKLQKHIDKLFPQGFSDHGERYFLSNEIEVKFEKSRTNPNILETNSNSKNAIIEILFEYVRRSHFFNKPSRFQSLHAFHSLDNAKYFMKKFSNSDGYIWKIECNNAFKANMNLLKLEGSLLVLSFIAHEYWLGLPGRPNPFWEFLLSPPIKVLMRID